MRNHKFVFGCYRLLENRIALRIRKGILFIISRCIGIRYPEGIRTLRLNSLSVTTNQNIHRESIRLELNGFSMYGRIHDLGLFSSPVRDMDNIHRRITIQIFLKQFNTDLDSFIRLVFLACLRILQSNVKRSRKRQIFRLFTQCGGGLRHIFLVASLSLFDLRHRQLGVRGDSGRIIIRHGDQIFIPVAGSQGLSEGGADNNIH